VALIAVTSLFSWTVLAADLAQTPAHRRLHFRAPLAQSPEPATRPAALDDDPRVIRWSQTFFWAIVLLFVFLIAAWVIVRFSLRFRRYVLGGHSPPTPDSDVWKMHKLPEEPDDDAPPPRN